MFCCYTSILTFQTNFFSRSNAFHRHHSPSNSTSSTCGFCRTSLRLGDKGVVSSPRFPLPYGGGESCLWLLQTADGSRIRLTCDTIQVNAFGIIFRKSIERFPTNFRGKWLVLLLGVVRMM